MTQREFDIINAINVEGLDNSDWGVTEDGYGTEYYGIDEVFEELPRHIYIWCDTERTYSAEMQELINTKYDRKYTTEHGIFLCLFWLDPQTL